MEAQPDNDKPVKLKIALIGYGKMGKAIEEIALQKGYDILLKITSSNRSELSVAQLKRCDVAIEFTNPGSAASNIKMCIEAGIPVISGSTGWLDQWDDVVQYCRKNSGGILYASNFSVGVNILFELNKKLAEIMATQPAYKVSIEEIHHTQKKDAPSGTAITIAEQIIKELPLKKTWHSGESDDESELVITSKRIDPAPGTHKIAYTSTVDTIELIHTAHNRQGFALGAVMAAEFIAGKKGIFSMQDVLAL
jgi:4-hydroxy-tetrahydrodipicolinate reductase